MQEGRWKYLTNGFLVTVEVSFFSVLLGILVGFVVAVIRATHDKTGNLRFLNALWLQLRSLCSGNHQRRYYVH